MLRLKKRGPYYHAIGWIHGRCYSRSLGTGNAQIAETRRRVLEQRLWSGEVPKVEDWETFCAEFLKVLPVA